MSSLFKTPKIPEPKQEKIIEPEAPIQDASIEIGTDEFDEDGKKRSRTGKGELKIPLSPSLGGTGLKV